MKQESLHTYLFLIAVLCFGSILQAQESKDTIRFKATTDFQDISVKGYVPYYIDGARNALAINAAEESNRGKEAAAQHTFTGEKGNYMVTLYSMMETDGECEYTVSVNGKVVLKAKNPTTKTDYAIHVTQAKSSVNLQPADVIQVTSNALTNGLIPEGNTTAYARGRWTELVFAKTSNDGQRKSKDGEKLRVIMTSDFPPIGVVKGGDVPNTMKSDPDDMQSMVRFLLYANEFEVEGLIASAGTFAMEAHKKNILGVIDQYEKVYPNLKTYDPDYPTADYLRSVTYEGKGNNNGINIKYGCGKQDYKEIIGEGLDSEASNAIIAAVDKPDPRPIWIGVWGGPREIAQAIWDVKNTRSKKELKKFISKLRVHLIYCQDATHEWLMNEFPDLFIIESRKTYQGMFGGDDPISDLAWVNENIRNNHGPLCDVYPHEGMGCTGVCEGDSPAFMHLISANRGINDPEDPTQPSWGGQFVRVAGTNHYVDGPGKSSISKWRKDYQKEFQERADWCVKPKSKQ